MGLDMYLNKKHYLGNYRFTEPKDRVDVSITIGGAPCPYIKAHRVYEVVEEIAYWRKANHIHKWFVDNVQEGNDNCSEYYVSREQLWDLVHTCENVLNNRNSARDLLPTASGFFFGNTEYNDSYYEDCQYTVKALTEALSETDQGDFYYSSSW